jgi:CheY-like chemotaxis protein
MEAFHEVLPSSPASRTPAVHFHLKALLADDNLGNRVVAEVALQRLGLTVECVIDGLLVLRRLETESFDLVILDGNMPRLGGQETAEEVRRREAPGGPWEGRKTFLVALTGRTLESDVRELFQAGFDAHLPKPLDPEALRLVLEKRFGRAARAPEPEAPGPGPAPSLLERLERLLGADGLRDYADSAFQDANQRMDRIRAAGNDRDLISREAHDLKSSAGTLGFQDLHDQCQALERHAETWPPEELARAIEELDRSLAQARTSYDLHLART